MSITTMIRLGVRHQSEGIHASGRAAAGDGNSEETKRKVSSAMEKISTFIPSEVIGAYVGLLGLVSPETVAAKWAIFGVCLALIPIIMVLDNHIKWKKEGEALALGRLCVLMVFAFVAFVAWSAALPSTPFLSFHPDATIIGGASVLILAIVMYKAAEVLNMVPSTP